MFRRTLTFIALLACLLVSSACVPPKIYADPDAYAMAGHLTQLVKFLAHMGEVDVDERPQQIKTGFDELDELWLAARPVLNKSFPEDAAYFESQRVLLLWWNRTLIWCSSCVAEGEPQDQEIVSRDELETLFADVPKEIIVKTMALEEAEACDPSLVTAVPSLETDIGCHAHLGAATLKLIGADLFAAGLVPKPLRGSATIRKWTLERIHSLG